VTGSESLLVPAGDIRLAGERRRGPAGGATLVLLHPSVADRRCWSQVAAELTGIATVVSYDRPGFGETKPAASRFSHPDDLERVLDSLGEQAAWLVGSSAGGGLALDTALLHPARVAGLVLLAPAVTGAPPPALDPATGRLDSLIEAAQAAGDLEEVNRLDLWLWLDGPGQAEGRVAGPARDLARTMNAAILRNQTPNLIDRPATDAWSRLGEISAPTTIACGDLDVPALRQRSQELAQRLPRARHQTLSGMAHLPFLEQPSVIASLIAEALLGGLPSVSDS
jgi:pimeloyl-ACP methyl ester carboxylesterase